MTESSHAGRMEPYEPYYEWTLVGHANDPLCVKPALEEEQGGRVTTHEHHLLRQHWVSTVTGRAFVSVHGFV